jgi:hypothetical protein
MRESDRNTVKTKQIKQKLQKLPITVINVR